MLLFAISGCAALVYELVWFQLLELVIGSSALSLTILLATFMGGICAGNLLFPRIVPPNRHPLAAYGLLEIAIAVSGAAILMAIPLAGSIQAAAVLNDIAVRCLISAIFLVFPTMLIGATFPAIARTANSQNGAAIGYLYSANIAGAVVGCLLAGFYLLRLHDMTTAGGVAVALNVVVATVALWLSKRHSGDVGEADSPVQFTAKNTAIYVVIGLSGFTAMGAELVWTRQLSLVFGATVYTFSVVLAALLIGLGIGSFAGSTIVAKGVRPRLALGICQISLTAAGAWTAWAIAYSLPYWPVGSGLEWSPWMDLSFDFIRCFWAMFPAACLWGASFPLALASLAPAHNSRTGQFASGVYAANTIGAIGGALTFGLISIPGLGTHFSNQALVVLSAFAGLVAIGGKGNRTRTAAITTVTVAATLIIAMRVPPLPELLVAYGRNLTRWAENPPEVLYIGEGLNSSVAVSEWPNGIRNFHVAGKVEASTQISDMRLQRLLGHLPSLIHRAPRSVLIVGFGAGVTAGTFVVHPGIEKIVICDIEPLIPEVVSSYFEKQNHDVAHDARVRIVLDDARHFLLTSNEKFDIITSDPIHPWVKGAASLYTREYFKILLQHLNPGGVFSQWVPLYDSTEEVVRSEFATFFDVFPRGTVWSNDIKGRGYDVLLVAQNGSTSIDLDEIAERLDREDHEPVVTSLIEVGFAPPLSIFSTYAGDGPGLKPWLENAAINSDRNLRLQYLAGLAFHANEPDRIYQNFLAYRTFPEELFSGSESRRATIRQAMAVNRP